jgi:hypothetical protein
MKLALYLPNFRDEITLICEGRARRLSAPGF